MYMYIGVTLETFLLKIYGDSAMWAILIYTGEDEIMPIQHFSFE